MKNEWSISHECVCTKCPYKLARGDWDSRRVEVKNLVLKSLSSNCSNIPNDVIDIEVLRPPDNERIVGVVGGHIFHGDCSSPFMRENRLPSSTPFPGSFLLLFFSDQSMNQRDNEITIL